MRHVFRYRKFIKSAKLRQEISYDWQARGHDGIVLPFTTLGLSVFLLFRPFLGLFLLFMRIPYCSPLPPMPFLCCTLGMTLTYYLHHIDDESYLICCTVPSITENGLEKPCLALETKLQRRWRKCLQVTFTVPPYAPGRLKYFFVPHAN